MKFYIASSFANQDMVKQLSRKLINQGHAQTYDWTMNSKAENAEALAAIGQLEKAAVLEADVFFILLPAGKGSHIELGMALAAGKKVYLFSEEADVYDFSATTTFYHLPEVERVIGTLDDLMKFVAEKLGSGRLAGQTAMLK
ncbi:nucleoside 2-deoxyribosyltransferase [Planococcus sp. APC 3906]|uniref:nucleoside 2-deoxyribosyltransferase n=1 Tax=Planococcus sp. APC 3906 TaxID=3035194 RepID=UPI0025B2FE56|nr:nucleoside 2-deoxyribosyltransferase [Planococcus sp. APC 3906]MDN3451724.1 nucleoside 2-deoxyribosyltransferase [Planococcus sp. APC 3906]